MCLAPGYRGTGIGPLNFPFNECQAGAEFAVATLIVEENIWIEATGHFETLGRAIFFHKWFS